MKNKIRRIVVTGTSGSGKTTLGKKLSEALDLPCTDLDDLFWLPEWIERDKEEFGKLIKNVVAKDSWVISGNYSRFSSVIWPRAHIVIWLDFPLHILVWRALKRSIRRIITRERCCGGNYETIRRLFSSRTIFYWIFRSYHRRKKSYSEIFKNPSNHKSKLIRLTSHDEVKAFLHLFSRGDIGTTGK